ncbi:MAG: hypothetical protein ACLFQB_14390 [Chitinispirillaceae bacterium]
MKRLPVNRTKEFKWNTRQELYDYFQEKFGLGTDSVDAEISDVLDVFSLRKGETIKPQELWQKVGKSLESRLVGACLQFQRPSDLKKKSQEEKKEKTEGAEFVGWYEI